MEKIVRYNPVINGCKICKICNKNKKLNTEFSFHSATGYYMGTCKECKNDERRDKYILTSGRREGKRFIKQKTCIKCLITKDVNIENFTRGGGTFSNICRCCKNKKREEKLKQTLHKGYLPDDSIKTCISCKEDKFIIDFSFSKKIGYYSSYCKPCDVKRKQEKHKLQSIEELSKRKEKARKYFHNNKPSYLYHSYKNFDDNKGLINDLTLEFIEKEIVNPCSYCGHKSTGLDRIDSSIGHTIKNSIPCCKECNIAKLDSFSYNEMLIIGKAIKEVKDKRLKSNSPEYIKTGLYIDNIEILIDK